MTEGGQAGPGHDLIVVGGSAGAVEAAKELVSTLPADLPASIFVVLHLWPTGESRLPDILSRAGSWPAAQAGDGEILQPGRIYVAQPDHHLLIERGHMRVVKGPRENRHRPSIDVSFRSAAQAYGPRVIGVVLTGADDDGTAGLCAIRERGGLAVVQDPEDALFPHMPLSALRYAGAGHRVPLAQIGPLLARLVRERAAAARPVSERLDREVRFQEEMEQPMSAQINVGTPSTFTCPECGGALWELVDGELLRYRCHVGHAFTAESALESQDGVVEQSLWAAVRALQESATLARRVGLRVEVLREDLERRASQSEAHAEVIRQLLAGR